MPARSLLQRLGARCGAAARRRHGRSLAISSAARCSAHAAPAAQVRTRRRTKAVNATWWCVCWAGARGCGVLAGAALKSSKPECRELCLVLREEGVEGSTNTPSRKILGRGFRSGFYPCHIALEVLLVREQNPKYAVRLRRKNQGQDRGCRAVKGRGRYPSSQRPQPYCGIAM